MRHFLLGAVAGIVLPLAAAPQLRTAEFQDSGEALINPMMGWMYEFYSDTTGNRYPLPEFTDAADNFPGNSTIYMRIPWSSLEPEEGKFTWNVVDAPAQRWIARGKKIALRFVTSGTGELEYATPKWVFDAGAKKIIVRKNGIDSREVIQDDPVFLAKLENFLREAAKRYNGNPDVAFLDVAFGTWGEGHTLNSLKLSPEENARQARIHALLYRKHFPDTLLAISDDVIGPTAPGKDFPLMKELRSLGITLRDDSVLCTRPATYHGELAQNYWPTMPVVLEHEHLAEAATKKMTWSNFLLLKTIEKYHASYLSIHDWPDSEKRILGPYLDRINRRLGYRIRPVRIDYPAEIENVLHETLYEMCEKQMIFPEYLRYQEAWLREVQLYDKVMVSYQAAPGSRVTLFYKIRRGEREELGFREETLLPVYENLYVKQFILYRDEVISYYFRETRGKTTHTTKTRKTGAPHRRKSGKYSKLNAMLRMSTARRKKAMVEFKEEEKAARQIFKRY